MSDTLPLRTMLLDHAWQTDNRSAALGSGGSEQKRQSAGMSIMWRFQAATSNPPQSALPIDSELLLRALYVNVVGVTVHSHREAEAAPAATD
ncbi:hypothetical protein NQZ68_012241 [Dissostichus eleginoides]|nr:hypothetical protein NQZ68_012241 [Dissostichus eleginoides]